MAHNFSCVAHISMCSLFKILTILITFCGFAANCATFGNNNYDFEHEQQRYDGLHSRAHFNPLRFMFDALSTIASRSSIFYSPAYKVPRAPQLVSENFQYARAHAPSPASPETPPPGAPQRVARISPLLHTVHTPSSLIAHNNPFYVRNTPKSPFYVPNRHVDITPAASAAEKKKLEITIQTNEAPLTSSDNNVFNVIDDQNASTAPNSCIQQYRRKLKCPLAPGYFSAGTSCYYLESMAKVNLAEARDRCASLNDDSGQSLSKWKLSAFNSFEELNAIAPYLRTAQQVFPSSNIMWIEQVRAVETLEEAIILHTPFVYVDRCDGPAYTLVPDKLSIADLKAQLQRSKFCNLLSIDGAQPMFEQQCEDTKLAVLCEIALNGDPSTFSLTYNAPLQ